VFAPCPAFRMDAGRSLHLPSLDRGGLSSSLSDLQADDKDNKKDDDGDGIADVDQITADALLIRKVGMMMMMMVMMMMMMIDDAVLRRYSCIAFVYRTKSLGVHC
jgi:hypothetical protein